MILDPFQVDGAAFLAARNVAMLADEPGLGKTVQAIFAVNVLAAQHIHVICPASVCESWRRHIAELANSPNDWWVESYDIAARATGPMPGIDVLILDEAHYLKNRKAKRTMAIYGPQCDRVNGLVGSVPYVFLLTGTPVPNNPSELWPHVRALFPASFPSKHGGRPMSFFEFAQHYCRVHLDSFGHVKIEGGKNLGELRERLLRHMLRRKKEQVLRDLPPVRLSVLPLAVSQTDVRRIAKEAEGYDEKGMPLPEPSMRRIIGMAKIKPMVEWVQDWFESGGGKLVLFAHHREVIENIVDAFPLVTVKLMGGASQALRQKAIDLFQNDPECKLFVGQLQAAGTGITLTAASTAILIESSWIPAENEQAAMRIHRIGQHDACQVYVAHAAGTIDEKIQAVTMRKMETIKQLFA
jgi:SWI/SNF-related matrix-associated actin-dependent regulator 1 of chromatin subfamily A